MFGRHWVRERRQVKGGSKTPKLALDWWLWNSHTSELGASGSSGQQTDQHAQEHRAGRPQKRLCPLPSPHSPGRQGKGQRKARQKWFCSQSCGWRHVPERRDGKTKYRGPQHLAPSTARSRSPGPRRPWEGL
jgi:hypothetical protein